MENVGAGLFISNLLSGRAYIILSSFFYGLWPLYRSMDAVMSSKGIIR